MPRRRATFIAAAGAVTAGAVAAVILLHVVPSSDPAPKAARATDPLALVPARAPIVLDLDTAQPLVALAVQQLASQLTGGTLDASSVEPLLGGPVAIALDGNRAWLAFATTASAPRGTVAARGAVFYAPDEVAARAAVDQGSQPAAAYARETFAKRFAGLPRDGGARVAFDPQALLAQRSPELAATRWGRSLRDGAAVLTRDGDALRVPFRIAAEPVGLTADDLPIATGAAAPATNGRSAVTVGLRDPARTLAFARDSGLISALDVVRALPGIVRPNLDDLGPAGTVTTNDLATFTLRTLPPDPGDWSAKLSAIGTFGGLVGGVNIARRDGAYDIGQNGSLLARVGVYGPVVMLSNDERADLRAQAGAPETPPVRGARGALTIAGGPDLLQPYLPGIVRARVRSITAWARAETTGVSGALRVALR